MKQRLCGLLLLMAFFLPLLAACGRADKSGRQNITGDAEVPRQSYTAVYFDIPSEVTKISRFLIYDNRAYLCCAETDGVPYLAAMDLDTGGLRKLELDMDAAAQILDFGLDESGQIWAVCLADDGLCSLKRFNSDGTVSLSAELSQILDDGHSLAHDCAFISIGADGRPCVAVRDAGTFVYLFDQEGKYLFSLSDEGNLLETVTTAEGLVGICAKTRDRMNYQLLALDIEKERWAEDKQYLGTAFGIYGGTKNSFYLFDGSSLYAYSSGSKDRQLVFNAADLGIGIADMLVCELSEGKLAVLSASTGNSEELSYRLAVLSPGEDQRTVLRMVSLAAFPTLKQAVAEFNKENPVYMIELEEYFPYEENVSDTDWNNAILKLNTQLMAGNVPDILDMSGLPAADYYNKGLLEDLYPYLENDPDIRLENYFTNVFDAISLNGDLPYITNGVAVISIAAASDVLGDRSSWTMEDLTGLVAQYGLYSFGNLTGSGYLRIMLQTDNSIVDWSNGECHFDSPEFIQMLEFAGRLQSAGGTWFDEGAENSCFASYEVVFNANKLAQLRVLYGGKLNMIGFPSPLGEYQAIRPEVKVGISSNGSHKEGAWAFAKMLLMEQTQQSSWYLPIHKGAFASMMQTALDGKSMWAEYYGNHKVTQEDVETAEALMNGINHVYSDNTTLEEIVLEQAEKYFSGDLSAQETASMIQSKASIYLKEQM